MPSRFVIRSFGPNLYYHVFNRGIEDKKIFIDRQDYQIFMYYLSVYLEPFDIVLSKYPDLPIRFHAKNLSEQLCVLAYCLMPNHFHFLIKQQAKNSISKFMKQLINAYTEYFNKKYRRKGSLMQGRFKAAHIESEFLLLHISRYIHLNPVASNLVKNLNEYFYSSYPEYIGVAKENLCSKNFILSQFNSIKDYNQFIHDQIGYSKELQKIKHIAID